ncbi:MAG: M50 family metallopeptidase [Desulfurococcaceae archaeon]
MEPRLYVATLASLWLVINIVYKLYLQRAKFRNLSVDLKYWFLLIIKRQSSPAPSSKYRGPYIALSILLYAVASALAFYTLIYTLYSGLFMQVRGTVVLVPGLNITGEDLVFFLLAVGIAVSLHEYFHAKLALKANIPIKSYGFALALIFPAAFVEIDESSFERAAKVAKVGILAAGVSINLVLFGLSALLLNSIASPAGLTVVEVEEGGLAWASGIKQYDIIYSINNTEATLTSLREYLSINRTVTLELEVYRPGVGFLSITLVKVATVNRLGVYISLAPPRQLASLVHPAGFITLFKLTYWNYVVNYSLVFLNALPLFITDGGRVFREVLGDKLSKAVNTLVLIVLAVSLLVSLRL